MARLERQIANGSGNLTRIIEVVQAMRGDRVTLARELHASESLDDVPEGAIVRLRLGRDGSDDARIDVLLRIDKAKNSNIYRHSDSGSEAHVIVYGAEVMSPHAAGLVMTELTWRMHDDMRRILSILGLDYVELRIEEHIAARPWLAARDAENA